MTTKRGAVVVRYGALGDMVMTTPILRALQTRHDAPCTVVGLGGWVSALFANLNSVGAIHTIKSRKAPYLFCPDQWALVTALKNYHGHPVYVLAGDEHAAQLVKRAGLTITGSCYQTSFIANEHQVDNHARVAGCDPATYDRRPTLIVSDKERTECNAWKNARFGAAPVVLLHAGNKKTMSWRKRSNDVKSWPTERWVTVIRAVLAHDPNVKIALTGAPSEREMTDTIVTAANDARVSSIAGETSLRRLLALLTLAHSTISVDTGPAHAAAAVGCPLVVLFGSTDPRINGPISTTAPVAIVSGPNDAPIIDGEAGWAAHHSMAALTAEAVITAWKDLR
jgi:ADP-heptose:LPS heptosyltransferase